MLGTYSRRIATTHSANALSRESREYKLYMLKNYIPRATFYASPPLKNGAEGILHSGLSVCECVSESVRPENLVNTISEKPMKGFSPVKEIQLMQRNRTTLHSIYIL